MNLTELNNKLPPGIRAVLVRNKLHYVVRTSHRGKKHSLGTFLSLDLAIAKLAEFKIKKMTTITDDEIELVADDITAAIAEQALSTAAPKISTPEDEQRAILQQALDDQGQHILGSGNKHVRVALNGKIHIISASIVAEAYQLVWGMAPDMPGDGATEPLAIKDDVGAALFSSSKPTDEELAALMNSIDMSED